MHSIIKLLRGWCWVEGSGIGVGVGVGEGERRFGEGIKLPSLSRHHMEILMHYC